MKTQISKSRFDWTRREDTVDLENACWSLITLLWKLDVIKYDSDWRDDFDSDRYGHQKGLVQMWYQLYMERKGT
jgi:hypothetical protein